MSCGDPLPYQYSGFDGGFGRSWVQPHNCCYISTFWDSQFPQSKASGIVILRQPAFTLVNWISFISLQIHHISRLEQQRFLFRTILRLESTSKLLGARRSLHHPSPNIIISQPMDTTRGLSFPGEGLERRHSDTCIPQQPMAMVHDSPQQKRKRKKGQTLDSTLYEFEN